MRINPNVNPNNPNEIREFFTYVARVQALTFGSSQSLNITIDSDANFTWVKSCFFADIAGAVQTDSSRVIPLVRLSIQDSGSGRNLQSAAVPLNSYAGTGQLPFILPVPKILAANTTIRFTFDNYSAATDYANVEFALQGYKIYDISNR